MGSPAPSPASDPSVLLVLLAFDVADRLNAVLERIPERWRQDPRRRILVIDDEPGGGSAEVVRAWAAGLPADRVTILRVGRAQGHGGVQKLACRFALDRGHPFVIFLPCDGQYPPESVDDVHAAWERESADVVLGSRMLAGTAPGPATTAVGVRPAQRIVTAILNRLAGRRLSDYQTGLRGYAAEFLRRIPFEVNTSGDPFDTEVILQAFHAGGRVVEVPVAARREMRRRRVSRARCALAAVESAFVYRMHGYGMLCSLKYRGLRAVPYVDKGAAPYSSHAAALGIVGRRRPRTVLDIGCGPGFVARRAADLGARVTGIDRVDPGPGALAAFLPCDLERDPLPVDAFSFDLTLLLDVIEHLADPERFLLEMRNRSRSIPSGGEARVLVLSTPNVAFVAVRANLLLGRFNYAERGILDVGHKRLFTRSSLLALLRDTGYVVAEVRPVGVPFEAVVGGAAGRVLGALASGAARVWPTMFAFQFVVVCSPLPGIARILDECADAGGRP